MRDGDYLKTALQWMRDHPDELEERVRQCEAVYDAPLECEEQGAGWLARKGRHVGTGPTKDEAVSDLYKKLALVLGGPFGPVGDQPPPRL